MKLHDRVFYVAGNVPAMEYAKETLRDLGIPIAEAPGPDITHLLLSVPSFQSGGLLRGGGDLETLLRQLSDDVTVLGGNLNVPTLNKYKKIDLLQDEEYLAANAAITAHCALKIALSHMGVTWAGCKVLVIGWGRIGKCLARLLRLNGADVTVAARKETDRAMLKALGYEAVSPGDSTGAYRVVFNTVPEQIVSSAQADAWGDNCVKIDLASSLGIGGGGVIWARGLPGVYAPESSGTLIAQTTLRLTKGGGAS